MLQAFLQDFGRLVDRDAARDPHVATDVVLVAGVDRQLDEFFGLGHRDALFAAIDMDEESFVERGGHLLAQTD